jgi:hypothetical protein
MQVHRSIFMRWIGSHARNICVSQVYSQKDCTASLMNQFWGDKQSMVFEDHSARWTFDTKSYSDTKHMRDQFVSLLYACGTSDSDFYAAELIYGELVGNVLRHSDGRASIALVWNGAHPTLTVHDEEKMFEHSCDLPFDPMQENGRGLYIVKALAVSLKFRDIIGDGSKVTAVLPVKRKRDMQDLFDFADAESA